jgi:hypothetical protein
MNNFYFITKCDRFKKNGNWHRSTKGKRSLKNAIKLVYINQEMKEYVSYKVPHIHTGYIYNTDSCSASQWI